MDLEAGRYEEYGAGLLAIMVLVVLKNGGPVPLVRKLIVLEKAENGTLGGCGAGVDKANEA